MATPTTSGPAHARARAWGALAALVALLHGVSFAHLAPCDDEYIVFRYARNLLDGLGPVFNAGERVEGYTVPLWMLLSAAAQALHVPPEGASLVLGLLGSGLAVFWAGSVWHALAPGSRWPLPAAFLAASPAVAYHGAIGLGTTCLAAALVLWLLLALRAEREQRSMAPAAWILGLAALLRAEAVLFAVPFLVTEWRRTKRLTGLLALAPVSAWQGFRLLYYGRTLPITYHVKKLGPLEDLSYGLRYVWSATLETGAGLAVLACAYALWKRAPRWPRHLRAAAIGGLLHAGYVIVVGGDYMDLGRFFIPALPILAICGLHAARGAFSRAPTLGAASFVLLLIACQAPQWNRAFLRERYGFQEARWKRVGQALATFAPDTAIALSPVGAIGFHSKLPIVDMLGTTNDELIDTPPNLDVTLKGHHRADPSWVLDRRPAVIILGSGAILPGTRTLTVSEWEIPLFRHPRFAEEYRAMTLPIHGSYPLIFFLRVDANVPRGAQSIAQSRGPSPGR